MLGIILIAIGAIFSVGLIILGWMQLTAVEGFEDETGFHQVGPDRSLRRTLLSVVPEAPLGSSSPLAGASESVDLNSAQLVMASTSPTAHRGDAAE
jgi:hypothetical protein